MAHGTGRFDFDKKRYFWSCETLSYILLRYPMIIMKYFYMFFFSFQLAIAGAAINIGIVYLKVDTLKQRIYSPYLLQLGFACLMVAAAFEIATHVSFMQDWSLWMFLYNCSFCSLYLCMMIGILVQFLFSYFSRTDSGHVFVILYFEF